MRGWRIIGYTALAALTLSGCIPSIDGGDYAPAYDGAAPPPRRDVRRDDRNDRRPRRDERDDGPDDGWNGPIPDFLNAVIAL